MRNSLLEDILELKNPKSTMWQDMNDKLHQSIEPAALSSEDNSKKDNDMISSSGASNQDDRRNKDGEPLDEDDSSMNRWYSSGRKRHFRRCNNQIRKQYICPYGMCGKNYGSEGSLNLHMKIKHQAGSKTEREKFARDVVLALKEGSSLSDEQKESLLSLPPGLLEQQASELDFLTDLVNHPVFLQINRRQDSYLESGSDQGNFAKPRPIMIDTDTQQA